jgi:hypothetical protein
MLALLLLLMASPAQAIELSELSIDYQYFHPSNRMAELVGKSAKEGLGLNMELKPWGPSFIRSRVHALTDNGQYRLVGWEFQLGTRLWGWGELSYHHHSQHLLEAQAPWKFGVEDSLHLKLWLMGSPKSP